MLASLLVGNSGQVHSFEPLPNLFTHIQQNIKLNCIQNVELNQMAVHEENKSLSIFLPAPGNNGTGSLFKRIHHPGQFVLVNSLTLDSYASAQTIGSIRLIKIDIDGFNVHYRRKG